MPIFKTIGLFAMMLTSAIWVGCGIFEQTTYYSQFNMELRPVPESDWRFGVRFREEASSENALRGGYALSIYCIFQNGRQTLSPLPDFPLFEQDLDVDSISIEGLEGTFKATPILQNTRSDFHLNLLVNETQSQTYIAVDESSSGCFLLTPLPEIPFVIAQATVQFPECKSNESGELYAVMGSGENEKALSLDDLRTFYDDNIGVDTRLNFGEVDIPRSITGIRVRCVVKIVNHFTSEVIKTAPVDVTLVREDGSYVLD